jgi:Spy/CpxP family protein refolding chaperone
LAGFALAQTADQPAMPNDDVRLAQEEAQKAVMKSFFRPLWNSQSISPTVLEASGDPAVRAAWGISDEQIQQGEDSMFNNVSQSEEAKAIGLKMQKNEDGKVNMSLNPKWVTEDMEFDAETIKKLQEIVERAGSLIMDATIDALDHTLTPEQWQKIRESQLANMDEMSFISLDMFEALNLTNAQRQEMENIKKELEPEFEAVLDEFINGIIALQNETEKDPALHKKRQEEMMSKGKAFSTKFKIKMFDVLTDEQWNRLQNLIDNPPEHAKVFRAKLKEKNGESAEKETEKPEKKEKEVWVPGPNSWKPGDAIPEKYRQERQTKGNFPRPKQSE